MQIQNLIFIIDYIQQYKFYMFFRIHFIVILREMNKNLYEPCILHQNELLQIICQSCDQGCLACPVCIDQYHLNHSMISLKKFISCEIPKLYIQKPNFEKISKGVDKIKQTFLKGFQDMRKRIGQSINRIQENYMCEAERLKKQISVVCGNGGYNHQNITAIKSKLKQKALIPSDQQLQMDINVISNQVEFLLFETTQMICKAISDLTEYWEISCDMLLNSKKKTKHMFSSQNKHELIELKSKQGNLKKDDQQDLIIASNLGFDSKYHMAIVEPALNAFKNEVQFKIQQSTNNCVWVGVCDLQRARQKGFQNCYKKGEGCYWIWQSGGDDQCQFFSSLLQDSLNLEHSIKVGDVITVRLQYTNEDTNKISFFKNTQDKSKNGKDNKILLHTGDVQKIQLHACVALGDELETISILL